ncbi:MAG: glycerol-3-phosphate dehydrogenase/oxidase [Candidatus Planktophila sp.]
MFLSQLNPEQRHSAIADLSSENFDVLVIGGGVTGVGAALDAASRGLKVALIESQDIAAGTSSRSSKLIHGGLRYLEQYDFKLVREALHERELLVSTLCPHLVKPVGFLFPLTEKFKERTYVGAGLALYDALRGFQRALPWHKHISQKQINEIAPSLRPDIILGAIKYFDAQVDDARHTLSVARTAARHGAVIATRVRAESLIRDGKRVVGVKAKDLVTGKGISINATVTVMCAGIWSDELHEKFELTAGYGVTMSKGVHIVLPGSAIKSNAGIILKTPVSVLFLIPWGDKWIVGTTDTPYAGDRAEPFASREDVQYILDQANRVLTPELKTEEIIGVYAGLRPLVANKKGSATTKLSREHTVDRPAPGFVSIAGGKYTTYRIMGRDVIDLAVNELRKLSPESVTEKLPLVGADGYFALVQQSERIAEESGLDLETVTHLLNRYGSMISEILDLISSQPALAKKLHKDLPYIKAEIYYAASHEGARSVDDVISRRTRIAFEAINRGVDLAGDVAGLIAPVLGWSAKERRESIAAYEDLVEREIAALDELLLNEARVSS